MRQREYNFSNAQNNFKFQGKITYIDTQNNFKHMSNIHQLTIKRKKINILYIILYVIAFYFLLKMEIKV